MRWTSVLVGQTLLSTRRGAGKSAVLVGQTLLSAHRAAGRSACATALVLGLLLLGTYTAFALGSITATADKQQVTVGEPFTYTVNMLLPQGAQPDLPGEQAKFKGLEIRGYQPQQVPQTDGSLQLVLRYTLVAFDVGLAPLKDFRIPVRMPDGQTEKWLAPPVEVTVASVLPEKGDVQPKGFVGPMMLAASWTRWLWPILIALLVIAAIVGGILLWRRRAASRPARADERVLAPDEAALTALQRLQRDDLIATGGYLPFYQRLGEIMRAWLQARFDIPALERTTVGTMYFLRVRRESDPWRREFLEVLQAADRVKFANLPPTDQEAESHLAQATQVITAAAPVVQTPPTAAPVDETAAAGGDRR